MDLDFETTVSGRWQPTTRSQFLSWFQDSLLTRQFTNIDFWSKFTNKIEDSSPTVWRQFTNTFEDSSPTLDHFCLITDRLIASDRY